MRKTILLSLSLLFVAAPLAPAAVRHVPSQYAAIQMAISDCNDGDVVIVEPGIYYETINFIGKDIFVTSIDPNDPEVVAETIIDADYDGTVVTFENGEGPDAVLTGFTITGGYGTLNTFLSPEVRIFWGAGIYCYRSDPDIEHNVISGNSASGGGTAIHLIEPSSAKIERNTIHGHSGSAAVVLYSSSVGGDFRVTNNTVSNNQADGIRYFGGPWCFESNLVTNNEGFGIFTLQGVGHFLHNDVWGNGRDGDTLDYHGLEDDPTGIDGNISADPIFGNPPHGNFHLCLDSPCIDAGDPSASVPPKGGRRIDMGAFEYTHPDARSGDVNRDGYIDYGDISHLVKLLSGTVPPPDPREIADVNCDEEIDRRDLGHLYRFLYYYGEEPCSDFKAKDRLTER